MSDLPADPLLGLLVELREIKGQVAGLISRVNDAIVAQACRPATSHSCHIPPNVAPFCAEACDRVEQEDMPS